MNEFFKTISLDFKSDKKSLDRIKKDLKELSKWNLFDMKDSDKLLNDLDKIAKKEKVIAKLEEDIVKLRRLGTKEALKAADALQEQIDNETKDEKIEQRQDDIKSSFKSLVVGALVRVGREFISSLKDTFNNALNELKTMTQYSFMTDSNVRELKLSYGFSSSQAYGYSQAMDAMGFSSMEDLMWADSQQLELFRKSFDKYTQYYEETMTPEYIEKQLEFHVAMKEFKMDMQHAVIDFFMENRDTIMEFMTFGIEAMKFIIDALGWLVDIFGDGGRSDSSRAREVESILNSYVSNAKSTNVNMNNTYNNVSKSDQTWLQNSSQMAYKQLVEQLNQG